MIRSMFWLIYHLIVKTIVSNQRNKQKITIRTVTKLRCSKLHMHPVMKKVEIPETNLQNSRLRKTDETISN